MAYFFFSGSSRGRLAGVGITLTPAAISADFALPVITMGTVLKLPTVEAISILVMPTIEVGIDLELFSVIVDTTLCLPSVSIGVSPWWYWDQMREGD